MACRVVFHVGFHKTGTTWLQSRFFSNLPNVALVADWREPWNDELLAGLISASDRHFPREDVANVLRKRLAEVERTGKTVAVVSAERLSGHPFSGGYDSFRIAERIAAVAPEAVVIAVVRNQFDLIKSVYKQLVNEGFCGSCASLVSQRPWKGVCFSLSMYEFDLAFQHYVNLFGPRRVRFLEYEQFRDDKEQFLVELGTILGVSAPVAKTAEDGRVNASMPLRRFAALRLLNQFRRTELNPFPVFTVPGCRRLTGLLAPIAPRAAVDCRGIRDEVEAYYAESNKRLYALTGIDLNRHSQRICKEP